MLHLLEKHSTYYASLIGIAFIGVFVRLLRKHTWPGWGTVVSTLITAGFGSMLSGMLLMSLGAPVEVSYFLGGMIGYSGGKLVDVMLAVTERRLKGQK